MSKKDWVDSDKSGELNTILGKGSMVDGTLTLQHSVRVDGKIRGNLSTTDSVIIGKEGDIEGELTVKNAVVGGRVKGKITATGRVVLESKATFIGEMKTSRLVIEEGAVFEGHCSMPVAGKAGEPVGKREEALQGKAEKATK